VEWSGLVVLVVLWPTGMGTGVTGRNGFGLAVKGVLLQNWSVLTGQTAVTASELGA
jgi:hypothetical protein